MQSKFEFLAEMASEVCQKRWIDQGSKNGGFRLPEEILDEAIDGIRRIILGSGEEPLKDHLLSLYVYCEIELSKSTKDSIYNSESWKNVRVAVRNFLTNQAAFDLSAWEASQTSAEQ